MSASASYDVVIAGGAVIGSSAAYHLAADPAFSGKVLVVEKDPTYQKSASALSAGSIRQQFSSPINIAISLYGVGFLRRIGEILEVDGDRPDIGLKEGGYLFLASEAGAPVLAENQALQAELGADIALLDPEGLRRCFPWLSTEAIVSGAYGISGEGWFDGYQLMQAFRGKARALGAVYRTGEVVDVERQGTRITAVMLASGERIGCGQFVNAAGTGAARLGLRHGLDLPIRPRKRMIFMFDCRDKLERFPLLIDPSGVYCRPEGEGFICGSAPPAENDPDAVDFEVEHDFFDEVIWPVLAARVPAFETIKVRRAWAGHYDMNLFDHNAFVGPIPGLENAFIANGFSGHGLQQSPAVGRGLAEWIVDGHYRTLDLSALHLDRLFQNRPLIERNVV